MLAFYVLAALPAAAQPPAPPAAAPPPPPLWDAQVGASFVGTTGNSETSSTGADFNAHRRGFVWQIDSSATAVRTSSTDPVTGVESTTAERYLGLLRVQRKTTDAVVVLSVFLKPGTGSFEYRRR